MIYKKDFDLDRFFVVVSVCKFLINYEFVYVKVRTFRRFDMDFKIVDKKKKWDGMELDGKKCL